MSWIEMSLTDSGVKKTGETGGVCGGVLFCLPGFSLGYYLFIVLNHVSSLGLQHERPEWNCTSNSGVVYLGGAVTRYLVSAGF